MLRNRNIFRLITNTKESFLSVVEPLKETRSRILYYQTVRVQAIANEIQYENRLRKTQ